MELSSSVNFIVGDFTRGIDKKGIQREIKVGI